MDTDIKSLVEDLTGNIDDLEESLDPIISAALSASTSKLPLLDKAKLYVLATYAIESVLFSALRLSGVDAKTHPVFRELARVKEYFEKIKLAESGPAKRNTTLDKDAAARFVKAGLSGNEQYDRERADRIAKEKAGAKRKAQQLEESAQWGSQNRFGNMAKRIRAEEEQKVTVVKADDQDDEDDDEDQTVTPAEKAKADKQAAKLQRRSEARQAKGSAEADNVSAPATSKPGPRSNHDTFRALLNGPLPKVEEQSKKKKKRKSRGEVRQEQEDKRAKEMM